MSGLMAACWMASPGTHYAPSLFPKLSERNPVAECREPNHEGVCGPHLTGQPDDLRHETELIICTMLLPSLRIPLLFQHTGSSPSHE